MKEEPKQETLEELAEKLQEEIKYGASISDIIDTLTKWQQEQDKKMYSDEDITKFVSFVGKNYIKAKGFYYIKGDFEKKHKVSIHQILEQFKNN